MRVENIKINSTAPITNSVRQSEAQPRQPKEFAVESQPGEEQTPKLSEEKIINAIESANEGLQIHNRYLKFSIHEETKEIMVKVIDTETEEVIREIPPEKILDMVAKIWELTGLLIDKEL